MSKTQVALCVIRENLNSSQKIVSVCTKSMKKQVSVEIRSELITVGPILRVQFENG